jgi:hypothetical protein
VKILALAAVLLLASQADAESPAPKPPAALEKVRHAFAAAVAARDRIAMAKLSRFPLDVEVYGSGPRLGERDFLRKDYFGGWFFGGDPQTVKSLATEPFAYQPDKKEFGFGEWYLDCNGNEYYFAARGGQWAFVGYENINE